MASAQPCTDIIHRSCNASFLSVKLFHIPSPMPCPKGNFFNCMLDLISFARLTRTQSGILSGDKHPSKEASCLIDQTVCQKGIVFDPPDNAHIKQQEYNIDQIPDCSDRYHRSGQFKLDVMEISPQKNPILNECHKKHHLDIRINFIDPGQVNGCILVSFRPAPCNTCQIGKEYKAPVQYQYTINRLNIHYISQ